MKKKKIYNVGMVVIALLMVFCGLAAVGATKGWFKEDAHFYASQKTGIVVVERNGLAYEVQESSVIKSGDILHTNTSSELEISDGKEKKPRIWLNGNTDFSIAEEKGEFIFNVSKGETFTDAKDWGNTAVFVSGDMEIDAGQSVISVSIQSGSSMVYVYSGKIVVTVGDTKQTVKSGQVMSVAEDAREKKSVTVSELPADALNDFQMKRLIEMDMDGSFCFAEADLRELRQLREKERIEAQQAKLLAKNAKSDDEKDSAGVKRTEKMAASKDASVSKNDETVEDETDLEDAGVTNTESVSGTKNIDKANESDTPGNNSSSENDSNKDDESEKKPKKENENNSKEDSEVEEEQKPETESETETKSPAESDTLSEESETNESTQEESTQESTVQYCTIEIRCDTILNNMENLASGKDVYVPADGTLLAASKVEFTPGETAFDVLKRACERIGMPLEYSYTPMYESYYVEGINQLYEFDCGSQSGWVYKVNGWFPNYGSSAYQVQENDAIVFCYTCMGLGTDVGGSNY